MGESALSRDRLMLGVFAWRLGYISQAQFSAAMRHCLGNDRTSMRGALVELGFLSDASADQLQRLLADQLQHHAGNVEASWASLACDESTINSLLGDTDDPGLTQSAADGMVDDSFDQLLPLHGQLRVLGLHAEGGLGRVHRASDEVLGREVALKEVRPEMADQPAARRRFVQEAQITGRLEHPGIVPVYGLGTRADGRPYYAMRMVEGETLTARIQQFHRADGDRAKSNGSAKFDSVEFRGLVDRLSDVAQAVRYAHSRGVLHRDLKPDNILLGEYGETLVIDWGLARPPSSADGAADAASADPDSAEPAAESIEPTQRGHVFGTVGYAPPEQLDGRVDLITERSDVYALGAVLYQMLVGRPPIHSQSNGRPVRELVEQTLAGRITPPRQVDSAVPKPLSAMSMRALAREPDDRYPSVAAFIEELDHWKADQPVAAAPDSWVDRAARLTRKYRAAALAAAGALVTIAVMATVALLVVNQARLDESDARQQAETLAEEKTQLAGEKTALAERNQRVVDAFVAAFRSPNPKNEGVTSEMTALQVLEQALEEIQADESLAGNERTKARLLEALAASFVELGEYPQAISAYEQALALFKPTLGAEHADTVGVTNSLGYANHKAGHLETALALYEEAFRLRTATLGPDDPLTLRTMGNLAAVHADAGRIEVALPLYKEALHLLQTKLGPDHSSTIDAMNDVAHGYLEIGQTEEGLELYKQVSELRTATLGADHPDTLIARNNLAYALDQAGRDDDALHVYEDTLRRRRKKLGPDHPDTMYSINNLAGSYYRLGRLQEAIALFEEAYEIAQARLGADHPKTIAAMGNFAFILSADGQYERAVKLNEEAFRLMHARLGPDHPSTLRCMNNLAAAYYRNSQIDQAVPLFEEALRLTEAKQGADHPDTLSGMNNLAAAYAEAGRRSEAIQLYEETLRIKKTKLGSDHPGTLRTMSALATSYHEDGRFEAAEQMLEETLAVRKSQQGPDHPEVAATLGSLANLYLGTGRVAEALALHREVLRIRQTKLGEDHPETLRSLQSVAAVLLRTGEPDEALATIDQFIGHVETQDNPAKKLASVQVLQAECLVGAGRIAEAAEVATSALDGDQLREFDRRRAELVRALATRRTESGGDVQQVVGAFEALSENLDEISPHLRWYVVQACQHVIDLFEERRDQERVAVWTARLDELKTEVELPSGPKK